MQGSLSYLTWPLDSYELWLQLVDARQEARLTQAEVAKRLGVSQAQVARYALLAITVDAVPALPGDSDLVDLWLPPAGKLARPVTIAGRRPGTSSEATALIGCLGYRWQHIAS